MTLPINRFPNLTLLEIHLFSNRSLCIIDPQHRKTSLQLLWLRPWSQIQLLLDHLLRAHNPRQMVHV